MTEKTFSQEDLNRIVTERLERQKRQFDDKITAQEEEKNTARLLEEKEFETLIAKLTGENTSFEDQVGKLTTDAEQYKVVMEGVLNNLLEDLSDEIKKAVDSMPGSVVEKLDWVTANKSLFGVESGDGVGSPNRPAPGKQEEKGKFKNRRSRV